MYHGMYQCVVCGKWYFNRRKLHKHLIVEHNYIIELTENGGQLDVES